MEKNKKLILITGGAGYIGSHTTQKLLEEGFSVAIYDNLVNGHKEFVPKEAIFVKAYLGNLQKLNI